MVCYQEINYKHDISMHAWFWKVTDMMVAFWPVQITVKGVKG